MVVGRQTNANTNCAWEITGLATNDSGTAAIVGTPTVTALNTVPSGWGSPTVSVTGSSTRLFFNVPLRIKIKLVRKSPLGLIRCLLPGRFL
jgi:hypothetical protein